MQRWLFAYDFDGVICDGRPEYFRSSWLTYQQLWPNAITEWRGYTIAAIPSDLETQFSAFRPIIETGWEMPILLAALIEGIDAQEIWQDWGSVMAQILAQNNLSIAAIAAKFDRVRDEWIANDLDSWLAANDFYPGAITSLKKLLNHPEITVYIITTKEQRFAHKLLTQQGVNLPLAQIFGKESQCPKTETLRQLLSNLSTSTEIWFIEDRLKTLQKIIQTPDLDRVKLFLADWGYNTPEERQQAQDYPQIAIVSQTDWQKQLEAIVLSV